MPQDATTQRSRRRAVVTGASAGIGAAFAQALARRHHDLVLVARRHERLEVLAKELAERHRIEARALALDLTEAGELGSLAAELVADPPDLLINNAGFGTVGAFAELEEERELEEIELNVVALVRLTRAALPGMLRRGRGGIVNVSSLAGESAGPYTATYSATKAFVTSFSESVHEEVRGQGVTVQALLPGFTRTEFQEVAGVDPGLVPGFAWMEAEQVVRASLAALDAGDPRCIPGVGNRVLGGLQALVPRGLVRRAFGAVQRRNLGS